MLNLIPKYKKFILDFALTAVMLVKITDDCYLSKTNTETRMKLQGIKYIFIFGRTK